MLMTAYRRGARLEYLARDVLRQQGYVVVRSAGSHGPFDLVAVNGRAVLLVQVKKKGQSIWLALKPLASVRVPRCTRKQVWVYHPARGRTRARWQIIEAPNGENQWTLQRPRSSPAKPSSK
jgi:Holliday junction resolvase-like predicted endonuclease